MIQFNCNSTGFPTQLSTTPVKVSKAQGDLNCVHDADFDSDKKYKCTM